MDTSIKVVPTISRADQEWSSFITQMNSFSHLVMMKEMKMFRTSISPYPLYSYGFELYDGRRWDQVIHFLNGYPFEPSVTLPKNGINDLWKVEEFRQHISFRDTIIVLIKKYAVSNVEVEWVY